MDDREPQKLPLPLRLLRMAGLTRLRHGLRPPRFYLTHDGPRYIAEHISHQFEDELDTRRYKAVQL